MKIDNSSLQAKYAITAWFYDLIDYPWERIYRQWRKEILSNVKGKVLEAGCGTGRNFTHYPDEADVTAIELSPAMLRKAQKRALAARASIKLFNEDATLMASQPDQHYDWLVSTFMCCVMPNELQPQAIEQFHRVLKPGGKFKLLEMVYSKQPHLRRRQERFVPFVEKVFGARFDRETVKFIEQQPGLEITETRFLKDDVYLLIEGVRR